MKSNIVFYWFRRDLRLEDNTALFHSLKSGFDVKPVFIFDEEIIDKLPENDARTSFIYKTLHKIDADLKKIGSSLLVKKGKPQVIWNDLLKEHSCKGLYLNRDYEPYALKRDKEVTFIFEKAGIPVNTYKDQVIFEKSEILKKDGTPYVVYTPFKNQWFKLFDEKKHLIEKDSSKLFHSFLNYTASFPSMEDLGFKVSTITVVPYKLDKLFNYDEVRDFPALDQTSYISPYLRFGQVSIRTMVKYALKTNKTFLSELIWREFFMQILFHFPNVVTNNFRKKYDAVSWRNNETEFEKWCKGETGYPIVDAGMRQLNATGYMHNRVRMITAGFLCKHLLIDWRWGEAYFAEKLLDYELSSNNGNWQWAAGTGCDAAPYFRIFNPIEQLKKFDKNLEYTKKWVRDLNELTYPQPIVDHKMARLRALEAYKKA
ncbi:deoxyribodipyrimidine photo-lyase [Tenacibaculum sp. MAR_2009_124]|uniref:cryptochrome/photolyase family protein n=1 Tax=Tenacibaculum sp. MAR_2009_124 TaxID=1250059 RepID=UPI00089A4FD7|nr:deoxyribodipyrimidine photo-lyase [Tenacibaculum sp. MAR_2009_124]SEB44299.1 deoxyribodipyrimidine photo-lyase [Tenacibaculum sp. MAR_2009_124]